MRPLGVHVSISGGIHRALERAEDLDCTAAQIFSHNPRGWAVKPLNRDQVAEFRVLRDRFGIHTVVHASYLINLAASSPVLREKSVVLMKTELDRADQLGVGHVILHPGRSSEANKELALSRAADSLNMLARLGPWQAKILLENTGGAKGDISSRMTDLGDLIGRVSSELIGGICLDTCHAHTAGYDLGRKDQFERLVSEVERNIGFSRVRIIHLNDSKGRAGSGLDRHQHIGEGTIGAVALGRLVNHSAFRQIPLILETPQETEEDDRRNLRRVRELLN